MKQFGPVPEVERPLIVSLNPFRFQETAPTLPALIITFPLPNPFGIISLAPLMKMLAPELFKVRAWMVVFPVQSLFGLEMEMLPLTVPAEQRFKLNPPVILPAMPPLRPPLPPMVVSPISVTVLVMTQPPAVR